MQKFKMILTTMQEVLILIGAGAIRVLFTKNFGEFNDVIFALITLIVIDQKIGILEFSGKQAEYEHNLISYWNCYNDTNGINYNNRSCQNYYFLGDGLTKEDLGLMFSGFNRVVVENEDEQ